MSDTSVNAAPLMDPGNSPQPHISGIKISKDINMWSSREPAAAPTQQQQPQMNSQYLIESLEQIRAQYEHLLNALKAHKALRLSQQLRTEVMKVQLHTKPSSAQLNTGGATN